ncbi:MAG TPA: YceI family protein [Solirubrobacteraceae bacterium]|nr:YceI family protein [Solirubrobacteraceae bacterium]
MSAVPDGRWKLDAARSSLSFSVRHMGLARVRGSFGEFEGVLELTGGHGSARGSVRVESVETGDRLRDRMIVGGDFFDAPTHPTIEFHAESADPAGGGSGVEIPGELTIAGQTRPLQLALGASVSADALKLTGACKLRRSDFGLRFRGAMAAGDRTVGDEVSVELELLLVRAG